MLNSLLSGIQTTQTSALSQATSRVRSESLTPSEDTHLLSQSSRGESFVVTLSEQANALLNQVQERPAAPTAEDVFARADGNADGLISEEEFVSARPDFASEEQAAARFAAIDGDSDGVLTQQELRDSGPPPLPSATSEEASAGGRPPPPPPPPGGGASLEEIYDELDTNEDGVVDITEMMAGLEEEAEEASARGESVDSGIQALYASAAEAYGALTGEPETVSAVL